MYKLKKRFPLKKKNEINFVRKTKVYLRFEVLDGTEARRQKLSLMPRSSA